MTPEPIETHSTPTEQPSRLPGGPVPTKRLPIGSRVLAAAVGLCSVSVLAVAAGLTPSGDGHGTHTDLGLPACGFASTFGTPCATCGMTTAFAHMADGEVASSFATQPMGAVLALGAAVAFWIASYTAVTGSAIGRIAATALGRPWSLWTIGALLAASWVYKIIVWDA